MFFSIDPQNGVAIYEQIVRQVKFAIAEGTLGPGQLLPSVRVLSQQLAINPNTIARVYTELEREGVLCTRPGLGVFVARPRQELTKKARQERLVRSVDSLLTEAVHLGFAADEVTALIAERMTRFQWERGEKKAN